MSEGREFELDVIARLTTIETILRRFEDIVEKTNKAYELSISNEKRLDKIEDKNQWAFRTSVGAVIGAVISAIVSIVVSIIKIK